MGATVVARLLRNPGQWVAPVGHRARATGCVPGVVGDDADVSGTETDGATLEQLLWSGPGHEGHGQQDEDEAFLVIWVVSSLAGWSCFHWRGHVDCATPTW